MEVTLLILLLNTIAFSKANDEVDMISDVIKDYDKPTSVVAKVCWNASLKIQWATKLSNLRRPTTINFINNKAKDNHFSPSLAVFIILDSSCEDAVAFLHENAKNQRFGKPYRWLIFGPLFDTNGPTTPKLQNFKSILTDSEVLIAKKIEDDYVISLIYRTSPDSDWYSEHFGFWSKEYGLNKDNGMRTSAAIRRRNLKGLKIVTSLIITDNRTINELDDLKNILVDTVTKCTMRHIKHLYDYMNATKSFIYADDWGYYINGSWTGMVGDMTRGDADIGGTLLFISKQRMTVVDYLNHPTPAATKFVFREPPLSYQYNLYLLPFKRSVWCCTGVFIVLFMWVLYMNSYWEIKKMEQYGRMPLGCTALRPIGSDVAIFLMSAVLQQGSNHELKGPLGRTVMLILFMVFLFLYTSYSANIVALLQSSSNQLRTLKDLLNSKLELGVEDVAYNRHYYSTATDPIRKAIYETKVAPKGQKPKFMSVEDGVKKLRTEQFAFNMNIGAGYRVVERIFHEHEKCDLQEIDYFQQNNPWVACKKNSPFKEIFRVGLFRIYEHGISSRENRLVYTKKPECTARGGNFRSVHMIDFYPVLLLLLYGMIAAFLVLFIEILVRKKQTAQRRLNQYN